MRRGRNYWGAFLVLLICAIAGTVAGRALSGFSPALGNGISVGLRPPANLDLYVLSAQFGFGLVLNLGSVLGIVVGLAFLLLYGRRA